MHKRRQFGLLPYSDRKYKKRKFQGGGSIATGAKGYDWRDDPYEQQLAAEKLQRDSAKYQGKNKRGGQETNLKNNDFGVIEGGLLGATKAANVEFQQKIDAYRQKIISAGATGIEWANGPAGIKEFQDIKAWGQRRKIELIADKDTFEEASSALKEGDRGALAMGNGAIYVQNNKGEMGAVSMDEYLSDKYLGNNNIYSVKVSDWEKWKKNTDVSMNQSATQTVLVDGAVSENTIYNEYIKGINFGVTKTDKLVVMGSDSLDIEKVREGLANMAFTDVFNPNGDQINSIKGNSETMNRFINSILLKVQGEYGGSGKIMASLQSTILKNSYHKGKLLEFKTVAERKKYLNDQAGLLIVNRVLLGEKSKVSKSKIGSTKGNIGESVPAIQAEMVANVLTGDKAETFLFGSRPNDSQVVDFKAPGVSNVVTNEELKLATHETATDEDKEQNFLLGNDYIDKNTDNTKIYTASGTLVSSLVGGAGTLDNELIINPYESIDLVYLPTVKGVPITGDMSKLYQVKIESRRRFIDFYNNLNPNNQLGIKAQDLTSSSKDARARKAYLKYAEWVNLGNSGWRESIEKDLKRKNLTSAQRTILQERLAYSKSSQKTKPILRDLTESIMGKGLIVMKPFLQVPTLANNDMGYAFWGDEDIAKKIDADLTTAFSGKSGKPINVTQVASSDESNYINYVGNDRNNMLSDDNSKFNLYMPVNNAYLNAKRSSMTEEQAQKSQQVDDFISTYLNGKATNQAMDDKALDSLLLN